MFTNFSNPDSGKSLQISDEMLRVLPLFGQLNGDELSRIKIYLHRRTVAARANLLTRSQRDAGICVLIKGAVKICIEHDDGSTGVVGIRGPGEVVGDLDGKGQGFCATAVIAVEPCQFLWIAATDFQVMQDCAPRISRNLISILAQQLRRFHETSDARHSLRNLQDLVARQLLLFAQDYGVTRQDGSIEIPLRITQSEIAALLGCTRESVNHILAFFKRRGYISTNHDLHITVHNKQVLSNRSHEGFRSKPLLELYGGEKEAIDRTNFHKITCSPIGRPNSSNEGRSR
jgi:CRP/FNR family cyclic AMP-dependent transcriptional regulator